MVVQVNSRSQPTLIQHMVRHHLDPLIFSLQHQTIAREDLGGNRTKMKSTELLRYLAHLIPSYVALTRGEVYVTIVLMGHNKHMLITTILTINIPESQNPRVE